MMAMSEAGNGGDYGDDDCGGVGHDIVSVSLGLCVCVCAKSTQVLKPKNAFSSRSPVPYGSLYPAES